MPVKDQGIELDRYMVIPRVLIFIRKGTKFLLLKGSNKKTRWAGLYNGLGGHVEAGEDVFTAAKRELWEESGLSVELGETHEKDKDIQAVRKFWQCGTLLIDSGSSPGIGVFIFVGDYDSGDMTASSEGSLHWIEASEIPNQPCVEDLPLLVSRISQMKDGDPPFSARSHYQDGKLMVQFSP